MTLCSDRRGLCAADWARRGGVRGLHGAGAGRVLRAAALQDVSVDVLPQRGLLSHVRIVVGSCRETVFVDRDEYEAVDVITCPLPGCNHTWCKACSQTIEDGGPAHSCDGTAELDHLISEQGWKRCPGVSLSSHASWCPPAQERPRMSDPDVQDRRMQPYDGERPDPHTGRSTHICCRHVPTVHLPWVQHVCPRCPCSATASLTDSTIHRRSGIFVICVAKRSRDLCIRTRSRTVWRSTMLPNVA